jgi:hypothetical protein
MYRKTIFFIFDFSFPSIFFFKKAMHPCRQKISARTSRSTHTNGRNKPRTIELRRNWATFSGYATGRLEKVVNETLQEKKI